MATLCTGTVSVGVVCGFENVQLCVPPPVNFFCIEILKGGGEEGIACCLKLLSHTAD
jgi:hypothetical protein